MREGARERREKRREEKGRHTQRGDDGLFVQLPRTSEVNMKAR
jgi:hypothetical protein